MSDTREALAYQGRDRRIWEQFTHSGTVWSDGEGNHYDTLSDLTRSEGPLVLIAAFCERCDGPIYDGQPAQAWALGLTGKFEHVTCPTKP